MENCRSTTLGGLNVGLDIWETAYVPSLLNNCSTIDKREDLRIHYTESFWMFHTLVHYPKSSSDMESWRYTNNLHGNDEQARFMNHILAKQIQETQQAIICYSWFFIKLSPTRSTLTSTKTLVTASPVFSFSNSIN